eukprot:2555043-Pleurochrysis_carterae.AAC.3
MQALAQSEPSRQTHGVCRAVTAMNSWPQQSQIFPVQTRFSIRRRLGAFGASKRADAERHFDVATRTAGRYSLERTATAGGAAV